MGVPIHAVIYGQDPNDLPRALEVDANGRLYSSIVIPVGTTVGLVAGTTVGLDAGESHVGQFGSESITIVANPTVTVGAYAANDCVGGMLTFANAARVAGMGGVLKNLAIVDDNGQDAAIELWLFSVAFTTPGDNLPWAPPEAELHTLVAIINSVDGSWFDAGTPHVNVVEVSQQYTCTGTSLFGQLVTRGTPTFAATDDVSAVLGMLQD